MIENEANNAAVNRVPDEWVKFAPMTMIRSGKQIVPFKPFDYQRAIIEQIEQNYGTIILKSRQLGITESVANWMLWKALRSEGFLGVILSKNQADTSNIAKRVRLMCNSFGIELRGDSLTRLELSNGGRLLFRNSTPNGCRGLESVGAIYFDEASFVENLDDLYAATLPSTEMLGDEARVILVSTPGARSGFYYDTLVSDDEDLEGICADIRDNKLEPFQSWVDDSGWCRAVIHWRAHPIYSQRENYLESIAVKKKLSREIVAREYDLSFHDPVGRKFSSDDVDAALLL